MAKKQTSLREQSPAASSGHAVHQIPATLPDGTPGHDYLQILIDRLRAGRVVLCAGAALGAGRPTWRGIVERLLDQLAQRPGNEDAVNEARGLVGAYPLSVAGFVRRRLGDDFAQALTSALPSTSGHEQPEAVAHSSKLPFRAILTTAIDDALVSACTAANPESRVFSSSQAEELRRDGRGRYILRLLGGADQPESLLFSESDLRRVLADDSFRTLIGDLYSKRSFLFVGFDPADPDFGLVVDRVLVSAKPVGLAPGEAPQHFALFTGVPRVVQEEIDAAYGIHALPTDQFPDELTLLRALHSALGDNATELLPDDDDLEGWLRVLQQEPNRIDANDKLAALEERLEDAGDADRLIELWLGRTEVETTQRGRAHCLRQVAAIFERKKGQMAEAFAALVAAFKESPDLGQLAELSRLAGTSGQWVDLLAALREQLPQLPLDEQPQLWLHIARLYADKLNHLEYALASVGEAQKLELKSGAQRLELLELRVDLSRRAERWKELADALGQLAAEVPSAERKLDLYLEQGDLYESRLSDGVSATAAFKKARTVDGTSRDVVQALEQSLRRHSQWSDLVALLDDKARLLESTGDQDGQLAARREAAQLCAEHLADRKQAIARWEAVRTLAPADLATLRSLEKLYTQEGSTSDHYLTVLSLLADAVPSDKERLSLYRRLIAEYEELPGRQAETEASLEKILAIDATAEDAYRGLERIYQKERRFPSLIAVYQRHIERAEQGKSELLAALGRVHEVDLPAGDPALLRTEAPAAIAAWRRVLDLQPEHGAALEALARLYQVTEEYGEAVRAMEKRARLLDDKTAKAALYCAAGQLCEKHQLDFKTTEEHYVRALEIDPQNLQGITALAGLYRGQHDHLRAAKLYIEAEQHTQNRLDKTRFLVEAARQYQQGDEPSKARGLFEQALKLDPEQADAAAGMVDLLWAEQRFDEVLPLLELLGRKDAAVPTRIERLCRLGQAALKLGFRDKALKAYQRAVDLDPTHLEALRGLLPLLLRAGLFVDARKLCQSVLDSQRGDGNSLEKSERVTLLSTLGDCEQRLGDEAAAATALREALALEPMHRPSLRTLLKQSSLPPSEGVELRLALLRALLTQVASVEGGSEPVDPTDERVRLLTEIGDLRWSKLGQPNEALAAYQEGLAVKPDSHALLHKCLEVYSHEQRWAEAADVLDSLINHEQSVQRRSRYRLTAGLLAREELRDPRRALGLLFAALDDEPTLERALSSLEELALKLDDPKELVRVYQRKIKAMGPEGADTPKQRAERLRLWTALSMLCIQRLGDGETGATAYEVTVALDSQNLDRRRQLAAIYTELGGDRVDKAIAEHHHILSRNKAELSSYRALKDLYTRSLQREKAASVAYALRLLGRSEPGDDLLIEELTSRPLRPANRPLSKELWRLLAHPDEDARLGALFQALRDVALGARAKNLAALGLNRKDRVDLATGAFHGKALRYAFEVLDSPMPEVYAEKNGPDLDEQPYRILIGLDRDTAGALPTACVQLGPPLLSPKRPEREVTYELGRLAALLRPDRVVRVAYNTPAQLGLLIDAALLLGGGGEAGARSQVIETAQGLKRALNATQLEAVRRIALTLRESGVEGEAAAETWLGASDLTAVRAGLTLASDLETVALLLATDPPGVTPLSPKQRLLDTIHFTVTEACFTIRQHLGLMS